MCLIEWPNELKPSSSLEIIKKSEKRISIENVNTEVPSRKEKS